MAELSVFGSILPQIDTMGTDNATPERRSLLPSLQEGISQKLLHDSIPPNPGTENSKRDLGYQEATTEHNIGDCTTHSSPVDEGAAENFCVDEREWPAEKEKIILGPFDYIMQQPGKDLRKLFIQAFNCWLRVPEENLAVIIKIIAMLHTASLLIDDVEDNSVLRRGIPVAHSIFGTAQTINSANYVYFLALEEVRKLKNVTAIDVFIKELLHLHRGQGMDLFWRDTLTCPTEDDYIEMVGNKTGGLFRLAIELMQAESPTNIDCTPLVNLLGAIFQICDDYLNLSHSTYQRNKGLCEDLTEGKFSFPIIHSIRTRPDNFQLINILKEKPTDDEVKLYAVKYMKSTGSFAYTREVVSRLYDKALPIIDDIEAQTRIDGCSVDGRRGGDMVRAIINRIVAPTREQEDELGQQC